MARNNTQSWFQAREEVNRIHIPTAVFLVTNGTNREWLKIEGDDMFYLDYRGARQALPHGSSPLYAFGGRVECGQYFSTEEVQAYIKVYGLEGACVFEYHRRLDVELLNESLLREAKNTGTNWKVGDTIWLCLASEGQFLEGEHIETEIAGISCSQNTFILSLPFDTVEMAVKEVYRQANRLARTGYRIHVTHRSYEADKHTPRKEA